MRKKECQNPSNMLTIIRDRHEAKACGNCVIPQILRTPCRSLQVTARLRSSARNGLEIKDNPEYPRSSDYPKIAVCQGNRAIALSTKGALQS